MRARIHDAVCSNPLHKSVFRYSSIFSDVVITGNSFDNVSHVLGNSNFEPENGVSNLYGEFRTRDNVRIKIGV